MKRDHETRRREYLAKAEDADKHAAKAREDSSRASWEEIARQYRKLADET